MRFSFRTLALLGIFTCTLSSAQAAELKVGEVAPSFKTKTQSGAEFDLSSRKGQWTVLYFYPKAGTPGCTKQACAFRDKIEKIRQQGADVFGVSTDNVADLAKFYAQHHLNFTLLADPQGKIVNQYGTKMPILSMSRRWTFIIDPTLKIRQIDKDVDPVLDSEKTAAAIARFKSESPK